LAEPPSIAHKHPNLTVFKASGRTAALACHPGRVAALFQKAGFVEHQHRPWLPQTLHDMVTPCLAYGRGGPQRSVQQVLKTIRREITAHFGRLPVVRTLGRGEQAAQIRHGALPRFRTLNIGRRAALGFGQLGRPSLDEAGWLIARRKAWYVRRFMTLQHGSVLQPRVRNHNINIKRYLPL
jgi:hypothetical protein